MSAGSVDNDLAVFMHVTRWVYEEFFVATGRRQNFVYVLRAVDTITIDAPPSGIPHLDDLERFTFRLIAAMIRQLWSEEPARVLLRQVADAGGQEVPRIGTDLSPEEVHLRAARLFHRAMAIATDIASKVFATANAEAQDAVRELVVATTKAKAPGGRP